MPHPNLMQPIRQAQRSPDAGHRINELPIGPTKVYALISEGKLKARKMGRHTIIVNWPQYLESLPEFTRAA